MDVPAQTLALLPAALALLTAARTTSRLRHDPAIRTWSLVLMALQAPLSAGIYLAVLDIDLDPQWIAAAAGVGAVLGLAAGTRARAVATVGGRSVRGAGWLPIPTALAAAGVQVAAVVGDLESLRIALGVLTGATGMVLVATCWSLAKLVRFDATPPLAEFAEMPPTATEVLARRTEGSSLPAAASDHSDAGPDGRLPAVMPVRSTPSGARSAGPAPGPPIGVDHGPPSGPPGRVDHGPPSGPPSAPAVKVRSSSSSAPAVGNGTGGVDSSAPPVGQQRVPNWRRWGQVGMVVVCGASVVVGILAVIGRDNDPPDRPSVAATQPSTPGGAVANPGDVPSVVPDTSLPSEPLETAVVTTAPPGSAPIVTGPVETAPTIATVPVTSLAGSRPTGNVAWAVTSDGDDLTMPVIAGTTMLVGSLDGRLMGVDLVSGDLRWTISASTPEPVIPSVIETDAYVVVGSQLAAIDPQTGQSRWAMTTDGFNAFPSSPVAAGATLVTATDLVVYAVDRATGVTWWSTSTDDLSMFTGSPSVAGDLVLVPTETGLVAFDLETGVRRWDFATGPFEGVWSDPIVADRRIVMALGARLVALALDTGDQLWSFTPADGEQLNGSPAVVGETIYVTDGHVYALDAATGAVRWSSDAIDPASSPAVSSTPVPAGEMLLVPALDGLYAIDQLSGQLRWHFPVASQLGVSVPVLFGDDVVVLSISFESSVAHGLDLATGVERWRVDVTGEAYFQPPVVAGNVVLVPGRNEVLAVR